MRRKALGNPRRPGVLSERGREGPPVRWCRQIVRVLGLRLPTPPNGVGQKGVGTFFWTSSAGFEGSVTEN